MADYRDWCGYCHQETNFGGHAKDCEWMEQQRQARQEVREFNEALYKEYDGKSNDEVLDEAIALHQDINALSTMMRAKERKWEFLRYELVLQRGLLKEFQERTGRRYI